MEELKSTTEGLGKNAFCGGYNFRNGIGLWSMMHLDYDAGMKCVPISLLSIEASVIANEVTQTVQIHRL